MELIDERAHSRPVYLLLLLLPITQMALLRASSWSVLGSTVTTSWRALPQKPSRGWVVLLGVVAKLRLRR